MINIWYMIYIYIYIYIIIEIIILIMIILIIMIIMIIIVYVLCRPNQICRDCSEGGGGESVGSPHRAQISQFDACRAQILYQFQLFELILLLVSKLDKQFPVDQFGASRAIRGSTLSVSSTPPPFLIVWRCLRTHDLKAHVSPYSNNITTYTDDLIAYFIQRSRIKAFLHVAHDRPWEVSQFFTSDCVMLRHRIRII